MVNRRLNFGREIITDFAKSEVDVQIIMDMGAGKGTDLFNTGQCHPKAQLYAIECYLPYVTELETKNVKVLNIDIEKEKIPLEDESVDLIISNQVFEHLKDIFWTANEISRVLKVGGVFIMGVPNLASLHNRFLLLLGKQPTSIQNSSAHIRGYTKSDVIHFFEAGFPDGLEVEVFRGANFYPFPAFMARPLARIFPSMSWGIFFKFRKVKTYKNDNFLDYVRENKLETNFWLGPEKN